MNTPTQLQSVCPDCGTPFTREDRDGSCTDCHPERGGRPIAVKPPNGERGYDHRWRRLSERARALQPFCTDCGSPYDLTTDHTPEAWNRRAAGQVIRLMDIDVVCRSCNASRGAARGPRITPHHDAGRLVDTKCHVCRQHIAPNEGGMIGRHRDALGTFCAMSGQPFPEREW